MHDFFVLMKYSVAAITVCDELNTQGLLDCILKVLYILSRCNSHNRKLHQMGIVPGVACEAGRQAFYH